MCTPLMALNGIRVNSTDLQAAVTSFALVSHSIGRAPKSRNLLYLCATALRVK